MKAFCLLAIVLASATASSVIEDKLESQQGFNCNANLKTYSVATFDVTPWPITKNTNLNLKMSGLMHSDEQLQTLYVNVLYGGQQFYVQKFANTDKVTAGSDYTTTASAFLPGFAPSGTYGVQVELQNSSGAFLNCWQVNFAI
mmetsp:Transcript_29273/g.52352  ORF Transcript_29273/g.52352 Transcript_29273/m.52352 type:complete len:143 (+) Transcript_29273:6624-7052(+)|eukprot:CAMPEP_0204901782 /NCGR_PEP_ID=MMETSP1397-20131031/3272_1 /ASSEMBLY_ACC=CAM_ASM_000891 /TAXON_ID=49980 /ORGANISM="Climacostomum Climacostomum virens, Strain Stock W-24" /LENGTH=142 /DNA_ID=CAMNT_0052070187 /DNA_START=620 /DNA_END=1048 /DNA_ORIENTATION=+